MNTNAVQAQIGQGVSGRGGRTMSAASTSGQRSLALRLCLGAGIVAPILFVLAFTLDSLLKPGYSAMSQAISYLEVGANGWIQSANFIILGLALILFALSFSHWMGPLMTPIGLRASTLLLLLVGLGFVNDGIFIAGSPSESPHAVHVVLHTIGFDVIFFSLPMACLIVGARLARTRGWRGYGWYSLITGLITLVPVIFSLLSIFTPATQTQPFALAGLINRIFVIEALAWYVVMGSHLFAQRR